MLLFERHNPNELFQEWSLDFPVLVQGILFVAYSGLSSQTRSLDSGSHFPRQMLLSRTEFASRYVEWAHLLPTIIFGISKLQRCLLSQIETHCYKFLGHSHASMRDSCIVGRCWFRSIPRPLLYISRHRTPSTLLHSESFLLSQVHQSFKPTYFDFHFTSQSLGLLHYTQDIQSSTLYNLRHFHHGRRT